MNQHTPSPSPAEPLPDSADPVEIAMDLERDDARADSPARRVLIKHERLLDQQIGLARNERFRNRIKAVRDMSLVAVVAVLLVAAGVLVWSARHAQGLVVEPMSVPPDLQARGLTDRVMAAKLLDQLTTIQTRAGGLRAARSFRGNWGDDVRVQLPQTGVSIAEAHRWLRRSLGEETYVSGEVIRTRAGFLMTARTGAQPGDSVQGADGELSKLLQQTAESLYLRTQPFQLASYYSNTGRQAEALEIAENLARSGPDEERAWAYTLIAFTLFSQGDERGAQAAARAAVQLQPDMPVPSAALSTSEYRLGRDEAALVRMQAALRLSDKDGLKDVEPSARPRLLLTMRRVVAHLTADYAGAARELRDDPVADAVTLRADYLALNHDPSGSADLLQRARAPTDAARLRYASGGDIMLPDYNSAAALDRWPQALASIRATEAAALAAPPAAAPLLDEVVARFTRPRHAYALARSGDLRGGAALIATTPADCYLCVRMRGRIAALAGDVRSSERWFAEAVRQGPSLPFAHQEQGEARLARGDAPGALQSFKRAQTLGPGWADPLKAEGDLLARQARHREAVRRYEAAAERAPRWGALHLAWGRSLDALGRREPARERYIRATQLDLSEADRAQARALLARSER